MHTLLFFLKFSRKILGIEFICMDVDLLIYRVNKVLISLNHKHGNHHFQEVQNYLNSFLEVQLKLEILIRL
jgi:hypothetical protein